MTESLLQALALAPGPQTAAELRDALRRHGLKVEEFEVTQELRRLQSQGIVRLGGTRWRLLKLPGNTRPIPPPPKPPRSQLVKGATTVEEQKECVVSPLTPPPQAPRGRWTLFRRLCRYYMDCLLQEEAPQLRAYVENQDDTWIGVQQVPWPRLAVGGDFAVALAKEQAPFQRNRARRGEDDCVYLGYPLAFVKPKNTSGFIVPLFVQPMKADWRQGVLHLSSDGPIAVNGAWLEYRFGQRTEREAFLRATGFLGEVVEEDDGGERPSPGPTDFVRIARDTAHYVHDPERFAQPIEPFTLFTPANWKKVEPGLYNTAILTLGPRLRYTRNLVRDLHDISEKFSDEELGKTALATVFPHSEQPADSNAAPTTVLDDSPGPLPIFTSDQLVQTRLLHPSQRRAVVGSLAEPVSVVTGPPGTGKSEIVAAMLLNQLLRGQPTLFGSKNHQALDAVLPRLNTEEGDLVIRTSSRELAQRQDYLTKLQSLLARPPRPDAERGDEYRRQFAELFHRQRAGLDDVSALEQAREEYEALTARLEELRKALPLPAQSDEALARWPHEMTHDKVTALEAELRKALLQPADFFQKVWHRLRRKQIESRRRAAREALLSLPLPFANRDLPDTQAPSDAWNDFFATWKTWAEAAGVATVTRDCELRIAQVPPAEDCNLWLATVQVGIEELTREWMAWAARVAKFAQAG